LDLSPSLRIGAGRCRPYIGRYLFEERIMKAISLLNRTVVAALLVSASVAAFAAGGGPRGFAPYPYSDTVAVSSSVQLVAAVDRSGGPLSVAAVEPADGADATGSQGKTRAQVRAELIEAEQAGVVPAGNTRYPAGPSMISRNKIEFQKAKSWWAAHGQGAAWGG
jgi:hypothetical protein